MKFKSNIESQAGIEDSAGSAGTDGKILSSLGVNGNGVAGVEWIDQGDVVAGEADKAKSVTLRVKNSTAFAMTKGQVICEAVSATPPSGNLIEVALADNNGTNKMPALGILNEDLDASGGNNDEGDAIMFGKVSGIDTSAFEVGDEVFVSDVPGGLTTTKPTGVKYIQKVGVVIRDDNNNGTIEVFGAGRVNDVPTPLYVDHANQRLGIGATNPGAKLEVVGSTGVIIDSGSSSAAKLTLIGDGSPFGGGASIDVIGGSNDYLSYILNIKRSPSTLEASNSYFQYNAGWEWNGNQSNSRAQPYTSYSFRSQGSSQMVIYNNNLGIGVTTPSQKLHVNGNARVTGSYYDSSNSPGAANSVLISTISGTVWGARGPLGGGTTNYLARWTPDGNTLGIGVTYDNGTSVGIGTTSPGTYKLAVAGSTAIGENLEVSDGLGGDKTLSIDATVGTFQIGDIDGIGDEAYVEGDSSSIKVFTGGGETLVCDINQRVGIGVPNPSQKLEVAGNVLLKNGNSSYLYLNNTGMFLYGDAYGNTIIRSSNNFRIQTKTGGGESVRVNSSGDVGIGTTIPGAKTHIFNGTAQNGLIVENSSSSFTDSAIFANNTSTTNGNLLRLRSSASDRMIVSGQGNVGIGVTSPSELLHLRSTGPARLLIEADSDNVTETDNAQIILKQDGGAVVGRLGYRTNTNDLELLNEYTSNIYLGTSNSIRATLHANGNFGIGNSTPQAKLHVSNGLLRTWAPSSGTSAIFESTVSNRNFVTLTAANEAELWFGNAATQAKGRVRYEMANNTMEFWTNAAERMTINSIGNVGINGASSTTTSTKLKVYGTIASTGGLGFQIENSYGSPRLGDFYGNFSTTAPLYVGSPYSTLACYAASFNVTSDYRLKENKAPLTKAFSRIKKLKPIRFNYINSENTVDGFLAHEVAEVIPEAVTGEKDAIREDGSDELQGLDLSKIVPLLTAALQESITKIEKLEQRIQTLENK